MGVFSGNKTGFVRPGHKCTIVYEINSAHMYISIVHSCSQLAFKDSCSYLVFDNNAAMLP